MTLVSVRLDNSYEMRRITALADARASVRRNDGSFKVVTDTTTKLFAIPVRCFTLDNLTPTVGAWVDPYHETQIGLGFSGSCFECLSLVAHITRAFGALVATNGDRPKPEAKGLMNSAMSLVSAYFKSHSGDGDPIALFLLFGFEDDKPWIGKITWSNGQLSDEFSFAQSDTLETIGQDALFVQRTAELRRRIAKHREEAHAKPGRYPDSDTLELEVARHELADKKLVEEKMLESVESEYLDTIGGVLQRIELVNNNGNVSVGYTQDDRRYLSETTFSVSTAGALAPIPIVETMGRKARRRPQK